MKAIVILTVLFLSINTFAQKEIDEPWFLSKVNKDSLDMWEYEFTESNDSSENGKLGEIYFRRKQAVTDSSSNTSIIPAITFSIYPISKSDSIGKLEAEFLPMLSCCYPSCGATIFKTKDYVFWSNPFQIKCAFGCSPLDYTRWNAHKIIRSVSSKHYNSLLELINDLPIDKIIRKY